MEFILSENEKFPDFLAGLLGGIMSPHKDYVTTW